MRGSSQVVGAILLVFTTLSLSFIAYSFFSSYISERTGEIERMCVNSPIKIVDVSYPLVFLGSNGVYKGKIVVVKGDKFCESEIEVNHDDVVDISDFCLISKPEKIMVYSEGCEIIDVVVLD